jgi:hypothetical protein
MKIKRIAREEKEGKSEGRNDIGVDDTGGEGRWETVRDDEKAAQDYSDGKGGREGKREEKVEH